MGLIDEEQVIALHTLAEEALQARVRIKDIIVIADNGVGPGRCVQAQLKGTDPVPLRLREQKFTVECVRAGRQQLIDRIVDPVEMPFCVGAGVRIAVRGPADTELFLRRQGHRLQAQALSP